MSGWLTELDTCASTNTWALEHLDSLAHGSVVFTRQQTGGRGRDGRPWSAPPGTLTVSMIVEAEASAARCVSLCAGLAIVHAVEDLCPALSGRLALKWPNDVILAGRKVAGVLCEGGGGRLIVGIGLNLSAELPADRDQRPPSRRSSE
jgi:BirA family biotin operon repressor/biotin-[acetyl-CoA-carboxylase] ligase